MKHPIRDTIQWTGTRSAYIKDFTNSELDASINRCKERIKEREDSPASPTTTHIISLYNDLMAELMAERANRIGK